MRRDGFTLMEILAALAILGTALAVLLSAHHQSLLLHQVVDDEVNARMLMEQCVSFAEVEVLGGALSGGGDFGARFPDYTWSYEATPDEDELIPLFTVDVVLQGPSDTRELTFLCFNPGPEDLEGGTGRTEGRTQARTRTRDSGRSTGRFTGRGAAR